MNIYQEAGYTIPTWNDLQAEYGLPPYIPMPKGRGIPEEL